MSNPQITHKLHFKHHAVYHVDSQIESRWYLLNSSFCNCLELFTRKIRSMKKSKSWSRELRVRFFEYRPLRSAPIQMNPTFHVLTFIVECSAVGNMSIVRWAENNSAIWKRSRIPGEALVVSGSGHLRVEECHWQTERVLLQGQWRSLKYLMFTLSLNKRRV